MTDHEQVASLLGVYALNAVDPDERALVEAHLPSCPRCRSEVDSHHEVVALIGNTGADAPDGVWSKISAAIDGEAPDLELPLGARVLPLRTPPTHSDVASADPAPEPDRGRSTGRSTWLFGAAAATVALVVGLAVGSVTAEDAGGDVALVTDVSEAARMVLGHADSTHVTLRSTSGTGSVEAGWTPDGQGFLVGTSLPALEPGLAYQLWGVHDTAVVSLGVLGGRPGVVAFPAADEFTALAITVETAGGVVSSNNETAYLGQVS